MGIFGKVCRFSINTMLKRKLSKSANSKTKQPRVESEANASHDINPVSATSKYFPTTTESLEFSEKFLQIQLDLNAELKSVQFLPPVAYVYNPVEYAFKPNEIYIKKYCQGPKKLLFVGMNPGPFGMCQTGVPFGEIKAVRDWLEIQETVGKPIKECPQRPVLGFSCEKTEVSGDRLWNLLKKLSGSPEVFFKNCFVYNYCPLAMMKNDGGNLTPSDIKDTKILEEICDRYFYKVIQLLKPEIIIGIGRYVEKRALQTLKDNNTEDLTVKVIFLTHPSSRVVNNHNWSEKAEKFFEEKDLLKFIKNE